MGIYLCDVDVYRYDPSVEMYGGEDEFDVNNHFSPAIAIENFVQIDTKCLLGGDKPRIGSKPGHVKRTSRYA
jgi:hypothetical protein